jgi:diguanylate cyclase (GGDEF)-like protein/PAS domain S-box-containing protein
MSETWSFDRVVRRITVMRTLGLCAVGLLTSAAFFITEQALWHDTALVQIGPATIPLEGFDPQLHLLTHLIQIFCVGFLVGIAIDLELLSGPALRRLRDERRNLVQAASERDAAVRAAREAEGARAESDTRFSSIFESAAAGMALTSVEGRFLQVNRSFCDLLAYSESELQHSNLLAITHPDDVPNAAALLRAIAAGAAGPFRFEKRYLTKEGRVVIAMVSIGVVRDQEGRNRYCVTQVENITARRRAEENVARYAADLRNLALTDDLTGLHNRRGFRTVAEQICAGQSRNRQPLMLVAIDVDYLKAINDTWGHEAGDRAIVVVATALTGAFRTSDVIARVGGDEFLCLLPNAGDDDVTQIRLRVASRIARHLEDLPQEFPLTVTVGVSVAPPRTNVDLDTLMREADRALYDAKRGRPTRDVDGVRLS